MAVELTTSLDAVAIKMRGRKLNTIFTISSSNTAKEGNNQAGSFIPAQDHTKKKAKKKQNKG
jgi:hypothetical protein